MNTNLYDRDGFLLKILPIRSDADRYACLRLLLTKNRYQTLCHTEYSEEHIRTYVEDSTAFLYCHPVGAIEEILCFAILKHKKDVMDILLICAVPNDTKFGTMIAHAIYKYAVMNKCKRMRTTPRTEKLRNTFLRHGFVHLQGERGVDEVLVKPIRTLSIPQTNTTRRVRNHTLRNRNRNRTLRHQIRINARDAIHMGLNNFTNI